MGALCVSSIALRPRTIWNAARIGTPAGQLEPSGTLGTVLPSKGSQRGLEQPAGLLEPSGTCEAPLERPQGYWNAAGIGTAHRATGTPQALERAKRIILVLNARWMRVIDSIMQSAAFFAFECLSGNQIAYVNQVAKLANLAGRFDSSEEVLGLFIKQVESFPSSS